MSKREHNVLGRGLGALMSDATGSSSINDLPIDFVRPNPEQPRRTFDPEALSELAASIKSIGLVQPITVRKIADNDYMIISGERRWRASQEAGLATIPAYIKTAADDEMMEMALIENIQRKDLNAIEIALAYRKLLDMAEMTQETLSARIGKNRATISNYLRLLRLPAEIQLGLTEKKIDMGHARTLLSLPEPEEQLSLYAETLNEHLSVRELERRCKAYLEGTTDQKKRAKTKNRFYSNDEYDALSKQLSKHFNAPVSLSATATGKGKLTIRFNSEEELMYIIQQIEESHR